MALMGMMQKMGKKSMAMRGKKALKDMEMKGTDAEMMDEVPTLKMKARKKVKAVK